MRDSLKIPLDIVFEKSARDYSRTAFKGFFSVFTRDTTRNFDKNLLAKCSMDFF